MEANIQAEIPKKVFKIASRNSKLAMAQTYEVIDLLIQKTNFGLKKDNFEIVQVSSSEGDQNLKDPLYVIGGTGVFTKNVEKELKERTADIAVHSLKDLPTIIDEELVIAAIPELLPRHDVFLSNPEKGYKTIDEMPKGGIIGTSSLRRMTSLKNKYPHLVFKNIRGNLNTRLKKLDEGEYDAIILAYAGLSRLGLSSRISQNLEASVYLYAPGQGGLGVQCRKSDALSMQILGFINDPDARSRCEAERQFLNRLEGGCKLPIGVYSELKGEDLTLVGQVWDLAGVQTVKKEIKGKRDDIELGTKLAMEMLSLGADKIITEVKKSEK